ncbi:hypothetical protein HELRODRAFT_162171 [Helobdella robusta]|uniref:Uncharacterized protein n=1 Tax=Helobdella robusta TaxID=6412 RepID=T1ESB5_HELRO|nr:hypothetical protein HELRODRAFT_162171 [Helobdella robusta]ESN98721.1 hypothetical protein HELRODRAFT_162171 [Helobdella robusta]
MTGADCDLGVNQMEIELIVNFNKYFTGFLVEVPTNRISESTRETLMGNIRSSNKNKLFYVRPFRELSARRCGVDKIQRVFTSNAGQQAYCSVPWCDDVMINLFIHKLFVTFCCCDILLEIYNLKMCLTISAHQGNPK